MACDYRGGDSTTFGFFTGVTPDAQEVVLLGWFDFLLVGGDTDVLRVSPTAPSAIPNSIAFLAYNDEELWDVFQMYPVTGDFDIPIFGVNTVPGEGVATASSSWTDVKQLYR